MKRNKKKLISQFRDAAEFICTGMETFACLAIEDSTGSDKSECFRIFERIYRRAAKAPSDDAWWINPPFGPFYDLYEARTLALLFAAEMVRTDSLP